jgi:cell division protein FtsB
VCVLYVCPDKIGSLCVIQNTIQKQKTQLSNLEDENKLMQAEVKRMESQV